MADRGSGASSPRPAARALGIAAALGMAVLSLGGARGQGVDCDRLYAAIQAADGSDLGDNQWTRAADRQRAEIERTQRYADQVGCNGGGLFDDTPAQCGGIEERLRRMHDNLASLESQARQAPAGAVNRRAAMVARYNRVCVGLGTADAADPYRPFDRGTMDPRPGDDPRLGLAYPDGVSAVPPGGDIMEGGDAPNANLGQAICVRTCDGGWFPLSRRATQDQVGGLEQLCQASCPNTEAKLYTTGRGGDLTSATGSDGTSYTALPAAFKFEKTFTPTCSCKPPNQSWAEALAGAEQLLDKTDRHDITVTSAMSDQMAKPNAAPAQTAGKEVKGKKGQKAVAPPAVAMPDVSIVRDAQKASQAPTASNDSTGIGGPVQAERMVRAGDGPTVAVDGPDGTKKRIRLIVP